MVLQKKNMLYVLIYLLVTLLILVASVKKKFFPAVNYSLSNHIVSFNSLMLTIYSMIVYQRVDTGFHSEVRIFRRRREENSCNRGVERCVKGFVYNKSHSKWKRWGEDSLYSSSNCEKKRCQKFKT